MDQKKVLRLPAAVSCLLGTGLTMEQLEKPLVAIVYSPNCVTPGHLRLEELARKAEEGVLAAGGTPIKMTAGVGVCDGIAMGHEGMKYSLPSRELNADAVEIMIRSKGIFSGVVFVAACDKNLPGYLMACARLDLPSIFITPGPMMPGYADGKVLDVVSSFSADAQHATGAMKDDEYQAVMENSCPGPGACAGLFTANSMACVTEALGMSLPGMATAHAVDNKKLRLAFESGKVIMDCIVNARTARKIMTEEAFENALAVDMAIGASTNTVLHIPAIAKEAGIEISLDMINEVSKRTPNIVKLSPSSEFHMIDFDRAGGISTVMNELCNDLCTADPIVKMAATVKGHIIDRLNAAKPADGKVIRKIDDPYSKTGGIMVLRGNLAPEGAVIKMTGVSPETDPVFDGIAVVFEDEQSATDFIKARKLEKGQVLVIRNVGPAGGPGMSEMLYPTSAIKGLKMDKDVALITDGRFSGGTAGICIGHVAPEAFNRGPIAFIRNGDKIKIDLANARIDLQVDIDTMENRFHSWRRPENKLTGILKAYRDANTAKL